MRIRATGAWVRSRVVGIVFTVATFAGAGTSVQGMVIFSITYTNNRINELDADTGALLNSYAPPVPIQSVGGAGLAHSGSQLFYSSIDTPTIFTLNPATGAVLNTFPNPAGAGELDALGFGTSSFGMTLFALDYIVDRVYLLNPATGAGFTSYVTGFDAVGGVDFNSATGALYVSESVGNLRALNPSTGAVLNTFGTGAFQTGVGFSGARLFTAPQSVATISERHPVTGAVLNSFASPGGNVAALAGPPVPEPACMAVMAASGLVLSPARRRRRI